MHQVKELSEQVEQLRDTLVEERKRRDVAERNCRRQQSEMERVLTEGEAVLEELMSQKRKGERERESIVS